MKTKSTPDPGDLRERALRLLARREHSRFELARKLEQAGFESRDIAALLDEFENKNWLSDRRFAESWVADHRARAGSVKLAYDLRQRGVSDSIIESVLGEHRDSELERAREVWRKKFGSAPADAAEKARQMRFLQGRGFSSWVTRQVLAGLSEDGSTSFA
jgi:regulatory protein